MKPGRAWLLVEDRRTNRPVEGRSSPGAPDAPSGKKTCHAWLLVENRRTKLEVEGRSSPGSADALRQRLVLRDPTWLYSEDRACRGDGEVRCRRGPQKRRGLDKVFVWANTANARLRTGGTR